MISPRRFPFPRRLIILCLGVLSVYRLPAGPADVSADLARFTQDGKIPGLVAAAVLDGNIIAIGATGVRKSGDPTPVTIDDKFHIGSCTKSMTGTLAAMLVADGKITWQTTVAEVFPNLEIHPELRAATLLQLASNTGGIPGDMPREIWTQTVANRGKPEAEQRAELVKTLLKNPPAYPPGTKNVYSNGGFTIAGAMLEKVSGMPYQQLISERLFTPLKLSSAGFGAPASAGLTDQPYGHLRRKDIISAVPPGPDADNPEAITPAGRVHLSVGDFARYAAFHLGSAGSPLLDGKSLDFLHTPVAPAEDYAVGWRNVQRPWAGGTALTHNGTNTMNYAVMWLAPGKNFAAVAACNIDAGIGSKACDDAVAFLIREYLKN